MKHTVAIALVEHNGRYLVGRRRDDVPLGGYHEFPGGKCHPNESPADGAVRECREETGLHVEILGLRHAVEHDYPYGRVHLHFFDCRLIGDTPHATPQNGFHWVAAGDLDQYRFPEPNWVVVRQLISGSNS